MNVVMLHEALIDLTEGFNFYEKQQKNLGIYFLDSLWSDIDSLSIYGGIHEMHLGYFRLLAKRFPFAIYYRVDGGDARVRAVLDCRRNPAWIKEHLG